MRNSFNTNHRSYLFFFKDNEIELINCLLKERRKRYFFATRQETRRKLLVGSHLMYHCLKQVGVDKSVASEAFSKSCHQIVLNNVYMNYSNTGSYHAVIISNKENAVDIEEYRSKSNETYIHFLQQNKKKFHSNELKLTFYKEWLRKELMIKGGNSNRIEYVFKEDVIIGISVLNSLPFKIITVENISPFKFIEER